MHSPRSFLRMYSHGADLQRPRATRRSKLFSLVGRKSSASACKHLQTNSDNQLPSLFWTSPSILTTKTFPNVQTESAKREDVVFMWFEFAATVLPWKLSRVYFDTSVHPRNSEIGCGRSGREKKLVKPSLSHPSQLFA